MYKVCKNKIITDKEGRKIAGQTVELDDDDIKSLEDIGAIEHVGTKEPPKKAAKKTTRKAAKKRTEKND